ncbi:MAG TPA: porin [Polyangia bacterium]|jgi:Phosphate-selective porin O and P.|nr:porin [Polyangia bacterium]
MKSRQVQGTLLAILLLVAPTVFAQQTVAPGSQAPAASEASPVTAPPVEAVAPAAPAIAAPVAPALDARLGAVETKAAGTEETVGALQSTVDGLKKIKISGYVQGRYEYHQDALDGWSKYKSEDRFYVRHGYLGAKYEGKNAEYFLQIDGNNNDGLVLKDAEATFVDTWTPFHLKLTVGQFKVPFGYEITQSDADREMPERSSVITGIFPGDRDRGVRLQAKYEVLRLNVALVNGASFGQKDPSNYQGVVQNGYDPNGYKTVVGRLGADLGFLVGGISGMWGRTLDTNVLPVPEIKTTFVAADGTSQTLTTPAVVASYLYYSQLRLGADVQGYIDVPSVGGLALKGELIWARKKNLDYDLAKADPCRDSNSLGWMITVVQNIGPYLGAALRFDQFDPLLSSTVNSSCYEPDTATAKLLKPIKNRDLDRVSRLGLALLAHGSANIKFTLSYEHLWEQGPAVANDIVTAQLQARF